MDLNIMENLNKRKDAVEMENDNERKDDQRKSVSQMNDGNDNVRAIRSAPQGNYTAPRRNGGTGSEGNRSSEGNGSSEGKAGQRPILGDTELLGAFFQELYGTEGWTELDVTPAYPSGPVPRSEGGLAMRRLSDPVARFYAALTMAEAALLVRCVAHDADERDQLNREIDGVLGLSTAVASGRIGGFVVCWPGGRYPKRPSTVRILTAPGQRTRSQVLGTLDREIRKFVDAVLAPPYEAARAVVSGRPAGRH